MWSQRWDFLPENSPGWDCALRAANPTGDFFIDCMMMKLMLWIAVFLLVLSTSVFPHEGDSHKDQLYRELKSPTGGNCCSIADCRPVESAWIENEHWKARYQGRVLDIPDDKIVQGQESPEGLTAVICLMYINGEPYIRCFVVPGQG